MRRLILSEFVTLDGVMEAPETWVGPFQTQDIEAFKVSEMSEVDALLVGAVTYRVFASSWPSRTGELADQMNGVHKYVVGSGTETMSWSNSQQLKGDIAEEVSALKQGPGEGVLLAGSCRLAQTMMKQGLVDEYRLLVYPVVRGTGRRLFADDSAATLTHVETQTFEKGVVLLRYRPATTK